MSICMSSYFQREYRYSLCRPPKPSRGQEAHPQLNGDGTPEGSGPGGTLDRAMLARAVDFLPEVACPMSERQRCASVLMFRE